MASATASNVWLTPNLPTATNRAYNQKRTNLFNAAESGDWKKLFAMLQDDQSLVNCPTSGDGWTPLHYAVCLSFFYLTTDGVGY